MMNCRKCQTPLATTGMPLYCPKCNPLFNRAGFGIDLRSLF